MTQEDKKLLLVDLCARLPYGVQVKIEGFNSGILRGIDDSIISTDRGINYPLRLVRPYLRPMSSMTEEERKEFNSSCVIIYDEIKGKTILYTIETFDWLNAHHFDYRGLIERGLAIAVKEENNPYKNDI